MSLYIALPVSSADSQIVGGSYVFETSTAIDASTISAHIATEPTTINTNIPDVGWTTSQVSTTNWEYPANSGLGTNVRVFRITSIGTNTSPTVSALNLHPLITEYFHSNHSNSLVNDGNGGYEVTRGNYSYNLSNLQFLVTGEDSIGLDQVGITYDANETIGTYHRTPSNDRGNIYYNGILWSSQTSQQEDQTSGNEGLAWYQQEASPTYITGITENNVFDNITSVENKKKSFVRASKTIADETSTALLERYTKLINLKLLDRLIEVDDYRDAERYALSKLTTAEQTTIKNLTRYS